MPADILRERERKREDQPAAAVAMEPVTVTAKAPTETPQPNLVDFYKGLMDQNAKLLEQQKSLIEGAQQGAKDYEASARKAYGAMAERLAAIPPPPPAPPPPDEPPPPSTAVRPFMQGPAGEGAWQAVNRTLFGLSLMAQMAAAPATTALQGFSGALKGWAEGDRERAGREWQSYLANVEALKRKWQRARDIYDMTLQKYGTDVERFRLETGVSMAELGLGQFMVDAGFKHAESVGKLIDQHMQTTAGLAHDAMQMTLNHALRQQQEQHHQDKMAMEEDKLKQQADLTRERLSTMRDIADKNRQAREAARGAKKGVKEEQYKKQIEVMELWLQGMDQRADELDKKGLLPKGDGIGAYIKARKNRALALNDPSWRAWLQLQAGGVGFDRTVLNDLGRARIAYEQAMKLFDDPPTREGVRQIVNQFRAQLNAAKGELPTIVDRATTAGETYGPPQVLDFEEVK